MDDQIIKYLTGDMEDAQRAAFEKEMETSASLRREVDDYKVIFSTMQDIETSLPGERMQSRFDLMLNEQINLVDKSSAKVVSMRPTYWRMIGIAASFALMGLFIGYQLQTKPTNKIAEELSEAQKSDFIQLVGQDRTSQKMDGFGLLENVPSLDTEVINTLKEVLHNDPSTNVRLAVIDALRWHIDQKEVIDVLTNGLATIDKPVIKIGIIQAISGTKSKQMVPALERALEQEELDESVRKELHVGIMQLSRNT